jgi:phosphonate transport system ATP-binding protein
MNAPASDPTAAAMLELQKIHLRYADGTEALRGVDLTIPSGQFCVLLGASGAGKSTLLRVVNGLSPPTSGTVRIAGLRPNRGECIVATIHQGIDLVPRLTVLDNVLCGSLGQVSTLRALFAVFDTASKRRACHLLDRVGLDETHLYRRADELSGGQKQRVGVARAFMSSPRLVLADEPVASLDPRTSREILKLLQEAARENAATVLCSLHDVELAREFADRILGMRNGAVVFDCAPAALNLTQLHELYAATA